MVRVGISCFLTDKSVSIVELAREVEDRGFGELWLPEHTHIPTSRDTSEYREAGLDGMALAVTWDADLDTVRRELDSYAEFSERYLR